MNPGTISPFRLAPVGGGLRRRLQAWGWLLLYGLLAAFPLLVLLAAPVSPGAGRWWDFSAALGFAGLALLGLQFGLTARFRRATAPFGMDVVYYFHRWAAVAGVGLLLAHYGILRARYPAALGSLNPLSASWSMTAGRIALLLFVGVVVSSLWRKRLRLEYDRWRAWHGGVSVVAVILAAVHVAAIGHFTGAPWKRLVWLTYTVGWLLVLGYVRLVKPGAQLRHPYRVAEVRRERGDAWTLTLEPQGHPGLRFRPGQFAWLTLGGSPFLAREHPFSFSGSAEDPGRLRFTIKELGDFTRTIGLVPVGRTAYVDGPHGVFSPDHHPAAPGFLFVAGGVGIAPIMGILLTLADRGETRPLHLIYGSSSWDRVLFREELEVLRGRLNLTVVQVLQDPPPDWTGLVGVLTPENLRSALPPAAAECVCFLCGPKPMTDSAQRALRAAGVPGRRIHLELFDLA